MSGAIPPLLQYAFMAWCLVKAQDNFTFYSKLTFEISLLEIYGTYNEHFTDIFHPNL
jgi:hypothetical protein